MHWRIEEVSHGVFPSYTMVEKYLIMSQQYIYTLAFNSTNFLTVFLPTLHHLLSSSPFFLILFCRSSKASSKFFAFKRHWHKLCNATVVWAASPKPMGKATKLRCSINWNGAWVEFPLSSIRKWLCYYSSVASIAPVSNAPDINRWSYIAKT